MLKEKSGFPGELAWNLSFPGIASSILFNAPAKGKTKLELESYKVK
jgi:hypothetical protein